MPIPFYFTFGTSKHFPFVGGWVEIWAVSKSAAIKVFRNHYPDKNEGIVNCASIYNADEFAASGMANGNRGASCHQVIDFEGFTI